MQRVNVFTACTGATVAFGLLRFAFGSLRWLILLSCLCLRLLVSWTFSPRIPGVWLTLYSRYSLCAIGSPRVHHLRVVREGHRHLGGGFFTLSLFLPVVALYGRHQSVHLVRVVDEPVISLPCAPCRLQTIELIECRDVDEERVSPRGCARCTGSVNATWRVQPAARRRRFCGGDGGALASAAGWKWMVFGCHEGRAAVGRGVWTSVSFAFLLWGR